MTPAPTSTILRHLRKLIAADTTRELADGQLLERFVGQRDEAAFAAVVERHGSLVLRVCRHVLHHEQDAEDAFQATFLVLARQAASVQKGEALASWLHGVAHRIALKTCRDTRRRRERERRAAEGTRRGPLPDVGWRELQAILDEEVARLPIKYRAPFVLCCLESKSRAEAASELGWNEGTLSTRIAQAKNLLRQRLTRRGVALSAVLCAVALAEQAASAAVPNTLMKQTTAVAFAFFAGALPEGVSPRAATLAQAILRPLVGLRLKAALVLFVMLAAVAGAGFVIRQSFDSPTPGSANEEPEPRAADAKPGQPVAEAGTLTDRYGDALPAGAIARIGTVRLRHGDSVWSVCFAPDGKTLASCSGSFEPTLRLWDATTGGELQRIKPHEPLFGGMLALTFSPDGKTLASGHYFGNQGNVRLWDLATGKRIGGFDGHKGGVTAVAYSPDGGMFASGSYDKSIRLWDVATGTLLHEITSHQGAIYSLVFSPDGATLASGSEDKTIRFWEVKSAQEVRALNGHQGHVMAIAFSPDGKQLLSGSRDKTLRLWDAATGKELRQCEGHGGDVSSVAFAPDGKLFASGSRDRTVRVWDAATGKEVRQLGEKQLDVSRIVFSPDGRTLAASGFQNAVCLWDVATGKELSDSAAKGWVLSLAYTADGSGLLSGNSDGTLRVSDILTGRERRLLATGESWVNDLAIVPDRKTLLEASYTKTFRQRDAATGKVLRDFAGHTDDVTRVACSPDGRTFASAGQDKTVRLWDATTGQELHRLEGHRDEVRCVTFAPDSKTLAGAGGAKDPAIYLWDVGTGKLRSQFAKDNQSVSGLAFALGGKMLVSAGLDRTCRVWDWATGKEVCRLTDDEGRGLSGFTSLAVSPSGRFLVTGSQDVTVRLWEVASGQLVSRFKGHQGDLYAVAFAPDGRTVASGSRDSTVLVWDVTGQLVGGRLPMKTRARTELEALWTDLASADAARAHRGLWDLAAAPEQSLPFLRERLQLPAAPEPQRLVRLIGDLESDRFEERKKATESLERLGELAEPALRKAIEGSPSAELRRRVEQLLEKLDPLKSPECFLLSRALEVIEQIGTPEARRVLEALAKGPSEARRTQEAKATLQRLAGVP